MGRFDSKKEEPSIDLLRGEVKILKNEIREVKARLHKIEIENLTTQLHKETTSQEKPSKAILTEETDSDSETKSHRIVSDAGKSDADSGADRNCIVEGLIPTKYLTKGTTKLYSATGKNMRPGAPVAKGPFKGKEVAAKPTTAKPFNIRPEITGSSNRYSALAQLPPINPFVVPPLPPSMSSNMLVMKKPFAQTPEPSSLSPSGK
ncbi:uncharacterized protein LOC129890533 [Solanum dulcamara]|uniref:uncharacterized protein LOC129890533 n=1 Tax=Solanum dulcamara TaxID=45834 RepID=UPI0024858575|nr:uncharacterized protein LOC129890533 [Solanum dulcamara]